MKNKNILKQVLNRKISLIFLLVLILNLGFVLAEAKFEVASFSCSPSELIQGSIFSCTAQIQNAGDAAATLSTAYLYPDSNNWLESSVYTQSYGSSIAVGESVSITFTGLKATKAGVYGFSKTVFDNVEKTDYVSTTKVKVIDVVVTVNNSASSSAMNGSFTSTATVVAGGNINVILTFTVDSGGCSIGNEPSQKIITGMQSGNAQSRTWTVTQGSSGDCKFTISAAATGSGTKIDTTPGSVSCTNCPTDPGSTSSSSSGGGSSGGGGAIGSVYILGELTGSEGREIAKNDKIKFNISNIEHKLTLKNLTESEARITIESAVQTFTILVGSEINVDLDADNNADINVWLKSINLLTKKASFVLTRVSGGLASAGETGSGISGKAVSESSAERERVENAGRGGGEKKSVSKFFTYMFVISAIAFLAIIGIISYFRYRKIKLLPALVRK